MPRLYHYLFDGIKEKITIQSGSSERARSILTMRILPNLPKYSGHDLIEETTESLVAGVSVRTIKGKTFTWTGTRWKQN